MDMNTAYDLEVRQHSEVHAATLAALWATVRGSGGTPTA